MTVAAELNPSDSDGEEEQSESESKGAEDATPQRASKDNTSSKTKVCPPQLTDAIILNSLQ
jgi:hypothetical protein